MARLPVVGPMGPHQAARRHRITGFEQVGHDLPCCLQGAIEGGGGGIEVADLDRQPGHHQPLDDVVVDLDGIAAPSFGVGVRLPGVGSGFDATSLARKPARFAQRGALS
ncbi:MAG: hypothetical protein JWO68_3421 [Actinomycetia bacterium]|nr:hypothetical protein [Actinomycetes bacterium]